MRNCTILLASLVVFSCSKSKQGAKEPTCEEVAAPIVDLKIGGFEEGEMKKISEGVLKDCKEEEWSASFKNCLIASYKAEDPIDAANQCEKLTKEDEREGRDKGTAGNKAKTTEAMVMLRKIMDGARSYYEEPMISGDSLSLSPAAVAKSWPASVGPTPPKGTCCKSGGKCSPTDGDWEQASWQAVDFSLEDPHYYSYEIEQVADGKGLVVKAYGDLDCDGEYSTFSLYAEIVDGEVNTAGDVIKESPLE